MRASTGSTTTYCGLSPRTADGGAGGMPPGFDPAANTLGVSVDVLFAAMEAASGSNADLAEVANILGVTEDALRAALRTRP